MLEVAGVELGPLQSVDTSEGSRRAEIRFDPALAFFTHREDFDKRDPALVLDGTRSYIREVSASTVRECARVATGLFEHGHFAPVREFHVWTAQQIFQVFSTQPPVVTLVS
ncbi:MAG: hypothetical protein HOQ01_12440 [Lysobacter sp.]|nr:hypothetical protein [Lysobacter sp.]